MGIGSGGMGLESLFSGNALQAVDGRGLIVLPPFVLRTLARRTETRRLLFSPHESDPCMTGYDEPFTHWLFAEAERRRLRDETLGLTADRHHVRVRRQFGAAAPAEIDSRGRVLLPAMMRARAGIGAAALVVGTGGSFEIWDPGTARGAGDPELRQLADFFLSEPARPEAIEEYV